MESNDDRIIREAVEAEMATFNIVEFQKQMFDELIEPAILEYIESQLANDDANEAQNERLLEKGLVEPVGPNQW
jgi:hypothetical protein